MTRLTLRGRLVCLLLAGAAGLAAAQTSPAPALSDTLSPVFRSDTTARDNIRAVEAGVTADTTRVDPRQALARADSLHRKLARRGPYVGVSLGVAFAEHSARARFETAMNAQAAANGQRILQRQDPVHVLFPGGLLLGIPLLTHVDAVARTEHSYYRVTGLAQKDNEAAREFWYVNQTHLAGLGARWHVPVSLLTVSGQAGLYLGYTHFWSFGPTGMRAPEGSVAARFDPAGAGMEIQAGFQQDFDSRWALTGGFSWSRLSFASDGDWTNVVPDAAVPGEKAAWTVSSMRFAMQGLYQFGRRSRPDNRPVPASP
ncbi:MAG TPA: hypothetical protein VKZ88_04280 [Fibrobacteria bacterium]|jgi:hypothetical protein|nr:hypothetical protein [Fibrobacteria bacterium]